MRNEQKIVKQFSDAMIRQMKNNFTGGFTTTVGNLKAIYGIGYTRCYKPTKIYQRKSSLPLLFLQE